MPNLETKDYRATANRLFSCRNMDEETYRLELMAALQQAHVDGQEAIRASISAGIYLPRANKEKL